ncbi:hypothetical protein D3C87_1645560 [compost metagenome]
MPRPVVPHRLQETHILEPAGGAFAVGLQHRQHLVAGLANFARLRTDHVAGHDRRRRLPKRASLDVMGKIRDHVAVHLQPDPHLGAAEFGMRNRFGIGIFQGPDTRDIAGEVENTIVVDVIHHLTRSG